MLVRGPHSCRHSKRAQRGFLVMMKGVFRVDTIIFSSNSVSE